VTTLYIRATGNQAGAHLSPAAGGSAYDLCSASNSNGNTRFIKHDVYLVTGATESQIESNVAVVNFDDGEAAWSETTRTEGVASQSVSGGTVLRVTAKLYDANETDLLDSESCYSGPLVATGISANTWTFGVRYYSGDYTTSKIGANTSGTYISNITLTGTPTSVRLYFANADPVNGVTTYRGSWNSDPTTDKLMGHKGGSLTAFQHLIMSSGDRGLGTMVTLPFVQAFTPTDCSGCFGYYETDAGANAYMRLHLWASEGVTDTLRGTMVSQYLHGTEMGVGSGTYGTDWDPTFSSVAMSAGDRLILECGFRVASASMQTVFLRYGGTDATDLSSSNSGATYTAWLELTASSSQNYPLTGSATGTGALAGPPKKGWNTAGSIAGAGACTGAPVRGVVVTGTVAGAGACSLASEPSVQHQNLALVGTINATGSCAAAASIGLKLVGTMAGTGAGNALIAANLALSGSVAAAGSAAGEPTYQGNAPDAPGWVEASISGACRKAEWEAVAEATSYEVYRRVDGGSWVFLEEVSA